MVTNINDTHLKALAKLLQDQVEKKSILRPASQATEWSKTGRDLASTAVDRTVDALQDMATRMDYRPSDVQTPTILEPLADNSSFTIESSIPYCKGAVYLQNSRYQLQDIIMPPIGQQCNTCKYCYLEMSDYQTSAVNYKFSDWEDLAKCHVLACISLLRDRRAGYRCYKCYAAGLDEVHLSAAVTREHLKSCSGLSSPPDLPKSYEEDEEDVDSTTPWSSKTTKDAADANTPMGLPPPPFKTSQQNGNRPTSPSEESRPPPMPMRPAPSSPAPSTPTNPRPQHQRSFSREEPQYPRATETSTRKPSNVPGGFPPDYRGDDAASTTADRYLPSYLSGNQSQETLSRQAQSPQTPATATSQSFHTPMNLPSGNPPRFPAQPSGPPSIVPGGPSNRYAPRPSTPSSASVPQLPKSPPQLPIGLDPKVSQLMSLGVPTTYEAQRYLSLAKDDTQVALNMFYDQPQQPPQQPPPEPDTAAPPAWSPPSATTAANTQSYLAQGTLRSASSSSTLGTTTESTKLKKSGRRGLFT